MIKIPKKIFIIIILILSVLFIDTHALEKSGWVTENGKTYYYDPTTGKKLQWWHKDETGIFYLQADGSVKQGLQNINGIMYYVKDNYIALGEQEINGKIYVFDSKYGELISVPVRTSNEKLLLVDKTGKHFTDGWINYNGSNYYQKDNYLAEGFTSINGKTYYLEPNTGKLLQWWHKDETGVFYLQGDGSVKQGLQNINGIIYYIEDNYVYCGEKEINGKIYVFKDVKGELVYGSVRLSDNTLMLMDKSGNNFKDGWITYNGNKYYQRDGKLLEGFQEVDGKTYYFEPNTGKIRQWWQKDENGVFYLQGDGSVKQGLQNINGIIYYIEDNYVYCGEKEIDGKIYVFKDVKGELVYGSVRLSDNTLMLMDKSGNTFKDGWITYNGNKYYQKDGKLLEGFQEVDGKTYYFETNTGKIKQWWQKDETGIFYLQGDGSVKQGLQKINGIYYFVENNYIYFGEKVIDDEVYQFNNGNGELKTGIFTDSLGYIRYVTKDANHPKGWITVNNYIYYVTDYEMACTGIVEIEGRYYQFGANGVLWGFYSENGNMYYKDPDGTVAKGIQYIAGRYYQFNTTTGAFEKFVRRIRVIDVSSHQGDIDWNQVKASGLIDGAILRLGYGSAYVDSKFIRNKNECERLGIPYSVYLFSYGDNSYDALNESNFVVNTILNNNVHINTNMFSIYYDLEDWEIKNTIYSSYGITPETYRDMITTFIDNTEKKLCIKTRVYASSEYIKKRFPTDVQDYATWVADWRGYLGYNGPYEGWQYTDEAYIPGISGPVDMSIFYY